MLRLLSVLLICFCLLNLSGCVNNNTENISELAPDIIETETIEGSITVYYVDGSDFYKKGISEFEKLYQDVKVNKKSFSSSEEMDQVIINELNKTGGPDVMLFDDTTSLDIVRMAKDGEFTALDKYIETDELFNTDNYLQPAIDACKVKDIQMLIPITYKLHCVFYDTREVINAGYTTDTFISPEIFFSNISTNIERLRGDELHATLLLFDNKPVLTKLLRISMISGLSQDYETTQVNEKQLRDIVEWAKAISSDKDKILSVASTQVKIFPDIASHFMYLLWNGENIAYDARGYESIYKAGGAEQLGITAITAVNSESVAAYVSQFGAVAKNTENGIAAYNFLRTIMDTEISLNKTQIFGMPVHKENMAEYLDANKNTGTRTSNITMPDGTTISINPISPECNQRISDILDGIKYCTVPNPAIEAILEDAFEPYMTDAAAYDDCYNSFMEKLDSYLYVE